MHPLRDALTVLGGTYHEGGLGALRLGSALLGVLALLYEALRETRGEPLSAKTTRRAGLALGALGVVCYFQFFTLGYASFIHRSETFHYYLGSKYFPELGYEGLYRCTLAATAEEGLAMPERARDLRTNTLVSAASALPPPGECQARFGPSRWATFRADVAVFRGLAGPDYWQNIVQDHGYNATPTWGILGRLIGETVPASLRSLQLLAAIDVLLMAGTLAALRWGFGLRIACLGALFWGTQAASTFFWIGGSLLRQDWLFCSIAALALLRRGHPGVAGASLAYAALARSFPAVLFVGAAVVCVRHRVKHGAWRGDHRRFFLGAVVLSLVLLPASVALHGRDAWPAFARHIAMHDATPTSNRMGWKAIVSHTAAGRLSVVTQNGQGDPFARWKQLREQRLAETIWLYRGGLALALATFVCVTWRLRTLSLAVALGACLLPVSLGLSCYYYSFLVVLVPLSRARRPLELAALVAALLSGVAAMKYASYDDRYVAMSLLFTVYAAFTLLLFGKGRPVTATRA